LPITSYWQYYELSISREHYHRGYVGDKAELLMTTTEDEKSDLLEQAEYFKRQGLL
jgi:hypothetical protein